MNPRFKRVGKVAFPYRQHQARLSHLTDNTCVTFSGRSDDSTRRKRFGKPEEIAGAGEMLQVDGGILAGGVYQ